MSSVHSAVSPVHSPGPFGFQEGGPQESPDLSWLDQLEPVNESELTPGQRRHFQSLRAQHGPGRLGRRRNGTLWFQVAHADTGLLLEPIFERAG